MREVEIQFLDLYSKDRFSLAEHNKLLFSQTLGQATEKFITLVQQKKIFEYSSNGALWLQLELYFKASPEHRSKMIGSIDETLKNIFKMEEKDDLDSYKKMGTFLMKAPHEIIRQVYLSNDQQLVKLFQKYVLTPPARFFDEESIPENIKRRDQDAQETIKKIAAKTIEPFILKAQRDIRRKRRLREELHRVQTIHSKSLNELEMTAAELLEDANKPYIPKCETTLSKRIRDAAQKVSAFSVIKHITSSEALKSVLNDALYGRRTLLDFYMSFNPAALMNCDILNGDGNVVCLGPQEIDPRASGSIVIEFDLMKLLKNKPMAFYKQKDLEYQTKHKVRKVSLGTTKLYFDHTGFVKNEEADFSYLKIMNKRGDLTHISQTLKSTLIAYDLERIHEVLTLNFFRFMDGLTHAKNGKIDHAYIEQFYQEIGKLNDEELIRFLTDIEKNMTDTAEFNFYGAHQIDFSTVNSISNVDINFTLQIPPFLKTLNLGDLDYLRHARQCLPEAFESYRFLDYLLTQIEHLDVRYYLDDLRKKCKAPSWVEYTPLEAMNGLKINWDTPDETLAQASSVDFKKM
jgi:hypothetical protein